VAFPADLVEVRGLGSIQRLAGWNAAERPPPGHVMARAVAGTRAFTPVRQPGSCPPGLGTAASSPTATPGRSATYDIRPMRKASETIGDPSANNTKAIPVRVPEKVNTRITRTKRRYPAQGGTTATMAMQAR